MDCCVFGVTGVLAGVTVVLAAGVTVVLTRVTEGLSRVAGGLSVVAEGLSSSTFWTDFGSAFTTSLNAKKLNTKT